MNKNNFQATKGKINKDIGKIKLNQRSEITYLTKQQTQDYQSSFNLTKLISPISKNQEISSFFAENQPDRFQNHKQMNNSYAKIYNQRKLNDTVSKLVSPPRSKMLINSADPQFAIQSQPNQLYVGRSSYFNSEQTSHKNILKTSSADKQISSLKFIKTLSKIEPSIYIKKFALHMVKEKYIEQKQNEENFHHQRRLDLIEMLIGDDDERNLHVPFHKRKMTDVKIPYYNKLVGLCSPILITKRLLQTTDKNIELIKKQKEQIKLLQESQLKSQKSFIFNFNITPRYPVDYQKRIVKESYSARHYEKQRQKGERAF